MAYFHQFSCLSLVLLCSLLTFLLLSHGGATEGQELLQGLFCLFSASSSSSDHPYLASLLQVVELMELGPLAGALVGSPGQSGLSVEQRKRLTIGVELCANPSVIFMDEPTSGIGSVLTLVGFSCMACRWSSANG